MPDRQLIGRRFTFYPPIRNVRHNDWTLRRATFSECLVANAHSGMEVAIPQGFIGAISHLDEPVALMELRRELTYISGKLVPAQRAVIELPQVPEETGQPQTSRQPGEVVSIRTEPNREKRFARRTSLALLCGAAIFIAILGRFG